MSKVILVRMEVKHEYSDEAEALADSLRGLTLRLWDDSLDSFSVEVVNEDPA